MNGVAVVVTCVSIVASGASLAHGGGLNAEGCHNNRKTGDYHCHRAPAVIPQQQTLQTTRPAGTQKNGAVPNSLASPQPGAPTCYVGPRGGTYTITKSGRKNYSGC